MLKNCYIKLIARFTPNCDELVRLASESLERKLSMKERFQLFLHHIACIWCKRYEGQLQTIHEAVKGKGDVLGEEVDLSLLQEGKERMKSLLKDE